MSWDRAWRLPWKTLDLERAKKAAEEVAAGYAGVKVEVEREDEDTVTCFFSIPAEDADATVEVSFYDLEADGRVISLEADASDNGRSWDDACELAEDLAELLEATPLDL